MEITRTGSKPSGKGAEEWFTGAVRIDPLFDANNENDTQWRRKSI